MTDNKDTVTVSDEAEVARTEVGTNNQRDDILPLTEEDILTLEAAAGRMTSRNLIHQHLVEEAQRLKQEEEETIVEMRKRLEAIAMRREKVMRLLDESTENQKKAHEAWTKVFDDVLAKNGITEEDAKNWRASFNEDLFLMVVEKKPELIDPDQVETTEQSED